MKKMTKVASFIVLLFFLVCLVVGASSEDDDFRSEQAKRRQVKMKTVGQLKKIFKELEIPFDASMGKDELRELAYQEDAVERWLVLHPEKRPKKDTFSGGGGVPPEMPKDMDPEVWEQLMRQMKGDFGHIDDPEKRRILEKLSSTGIKFSGGADMDIEQLRSLEKMIDEQNFPGMEKDL